MDADDISELDRLFRQVEYLESHPAVGLLGTGRRLINEAGERLTDVPAVSGRLRVLWKTLLGNAFTHPSVMLRRDVLEQNRLRYAETFLTAQDYELWVRMLQHTAADNLTESLIRYRLRDDGISRTKKADQLANHDRIALNAIRVILPGFEIAAQDVRQLRGRFGGFSVREPELDPTDERWAGVYVAMFTALLNRYGGNPSPKTN